MTAFNEGLVLQRLNELASTQESIQTISLWIIHHRQHYAEVVKIWLRELQIVSESKKLTFMHLAHDIIVNSRKKAPEYGTEFEAVLPMVFALFGSSCRSDTLFAGLGRILNTWSELGVFDAKTICNYRTKIIKTERKDNEASAKADSVQPSWDGIATRTDLPVILSKVKQEYESAKRMKLELGDITIEERKYSCHPGYNEYESSACAGTDAIEAMAIDVSQGDANAALRAALTYERIANWMPNISETDFRNKLSNKKTAKALEKQVNIAVQQLSDHNDRMRLVVEQCNNLAILLRDLQLEQVELLAHAERHMKKYKMDLDNMLVVQNLVKGYLSK